MRDQWNAMKECCRCNPAIGSLYRTAVSSRAVHRLSPVVTQVSIKRRDHELLKELLHLFALGSPPMSLKRPAVSFRQWHEGDYYELAVQMWEVQITSRVFFEDKR